MKTLPRVVFFGNEQLASGLSPEQTPLFDGLLAAGYDIVAIVVRPDAPKGRGKKIVPSLIKQKALSLGIPVLQPSTSDELYSELKMYSGCIGILAAYGRIVPQRVIDLFEPYCIVNLHPSLLPHYRGSSPIEAAILHGDSETGISLMRLSAGMDEGPLFAQVSLALKGDETKQALYESLVSRGLTCLLDVLPSIVDGTVVAQPQRIADVSYTTRITKSAGILSPETETAEELERAIRAYQGFPKPHLQLHGIDVIVTMSKIVPHQNASPLVVSCKDDSYLQILEIIAPSGKKMNAEAFIRGYLRAS